MAHECKKCSEALRKEREAEERVKAYAAMLGYFIDEAKRAPKARPEGVLIGAATAAGEG